MKPPMAAPMITSPSRTLIAAIIPSSRFVVASPPAMCGTSEWRRLMRAGVARRLPAFAERVVQERPALVGDGRRLLDRRPEAHELAREVVERRLDLPPY